MSEYPSDNEIRDYYEQRYITGEETAFGRPLEESVQRLNYLPDVKNKAILDVACGQGFFLHAVNSRGGMAYGIDISHEATLIAKRFASHAQVYVANGQRLPFPDNSFDMLTCWGSLEHHPDMAQALSEFIRVTKSGAAIVIRVPNRDFWLYRMMRLLLRREVGSEQLEMVEHLLSLVEWRSLFESAGLDILTVQADNWYLQDSIARMPSIRAKLRMMFRKLTLAIAPLQYTYVLDFRCVSRKA